MREQVRKWRWDCECVWFFERSKNQTRKWGEVRWKLAACELRDWPWKGFGSWRSASAALRWRPCSPQLWPSSGRWTLCPSSSACGAGWAQIWWPGLKMSSCFLWPAVEEMDMKRHSHVNAIDHLWPPLFLHEWESFRNESKYICIDV